MYNAGCAANFSVPGSGKTSVVLAYYESFCLNNMTRLESQLSHVIVALLLLSLPNLLKLGELLLAELNTKIYRCICVLEKYLPCLAVHV